VAKPLTDYRPFQGHDT